MSFPIAAHHGGMSHHQAFTAMTGISEHVSVSQTAPQAVCSGYGLLAGTTSAMATPRLVAARGTSLRAARRELDAHLISFHPACQPPRGCGAGVPGHKALHTCGSGVNGYVPVGGNQEDEAAVLGLGNILLGTTSHSFSADFYGIQREHYLDSLSKRGHAPP